MKVERLALFHAVFVLLLNGKNILQAPMENPRLSFWGMREQQKQYSEGKPLKIEGWKMNFFFGSYIFRGLC